MGVHGEVFSTRIARHVVNAELYELAEEVASNGGIGLGTFHTYDELDYDA